MLPKHVSFKSLQEEVYKRSTNLAWGSNIRARLYIKVGNIIKQNEEKNQEVRNKRTDAPGKNRKVEEFLRSSLF